MWDVDYPSPNQPITDTMIADAEAELGVLLPRDFIASLRIKNGGSIIGGFAKLLTEEIPEDLRRFVSDGHVRIYDINGIGQSDCSILSTTYLVNEWDLPEPIVILSGDGHWWIVLDYRESADNPPVVFLDSLTRISLKIADDFGVFSRSLVRHEDLYDTDGTFIG